MRKLFICIISIASLWAVESSSVVGKTTNEVSVTGLSVEMLSNPVGLGTSHPRFSWKLESSSRDVLQKDYRILVASSMKISTKGLETSGIAESLNQTIIIYSIRRQIS
jgi:hypothetical protein